MPDQAGERLVLFARVIDISRGIKNFPPFWSIRLPQPVPDHAVEELVHLRGGFFLAVIEPPAHQRQQASGEGVGADGEFRFRQLREASSVEEALFDAASEVVLREIEEVVEAELREATFPC